MGLAVLLLSNRVVYPYDKLHQWIHSMMLGSFDSIIARHSHHLKRFWQMIAHRYNSERLWLPATGWYLIRVLLNHYSWTFQTSYYVNRFEGPSINQQWIWREICFQNCANVQYLESRYLGRTQPYWGSVLISKQLQSQIFFIQIIVKLRNVFSSQRGNEKKRRKFHF